MNKYNHVLVKQHCDPHVFRGQLINPPDLDVAGVIQDHWERRLNAGANRFGFAQVYRVGEKISLQGWVG